MSKNAPLVSIVTPVYNAAEFLSETIRTVQDQTYQNWELILINDKSEDDSEVVIRRYLTADPRIKLINMEENCGVATARNRGIKKAKGHYLAFLDADDLWVKNKLEIQVTHMKNNRQVFTFTSYEFADAKGVPNGKIVKVPSKIKLKDALKNNIIFTCTVMLDLSRINKRYIYMENRSYGEDATTWWRLLHMYEEAYGLDEVLTYYRRSSNSLTANKFKAVISKWKLYRGQGYISSIGQLYYYLNSLVNAARKRI